MHIEDSKAFLDLHAALRNHVEHLPMAANALPALGLAERIELIERVVALVSEVLLPHAAAEERVLYPRAARLLGRPDESGSVVNDEAAMRAWIAELHETDSTDTGRLQELMYGLYLLLSTHFGREEQLYMELLSSDREAEAQDLLTAVAG